MDWTFNIFRVADIYQSEEIHTRIIADLINPKSTFHNNGKRFLREFAESMEFSKYNINLDYDKAFVETEIVTRSIARMRRVDLIICDYTYYIPFEVKIHGRDQDRQIDDYLEHAERQGVKVPVLFYLNKDGKGPGNISVSELNKLKVKTVTFKKQIIDWLIRCSTLNGVSADIRVIIMHLIENIEGNFTKGDNVIDLIRDGLVKYNYECTEDTGRYLTYRFRKEDHHLEFALRITRDGDKVVLSIICGVIIDGCVDYRYDNAKAYIEKSESNMIEYESLFERTFNDKAQMMDKGVISKALNPYRWDKLEQSFPLVRVIDRVDDVDVFARKCIEAIERLLDTILLKD